jgi:hypothetical protein
MVQNQQEPTLQTWQEFIMDSGCTNSMVNLRSHLYDMEPCAIEVSYGNGTTQTAVEKGTIDIDGVQLYNVLLVPGLRRNLLSESQLTSYGFTIYTDNEKKQVFDRNNVLKFTAKHEGMLYIWRPSGIAQSFLAGTEPQSKADAWHLRLGHLNFRDMQLLKELSTGISFGENRLTFCEDCYKSKMTARSFKPKKEKPVKFLEKVYVDLVGPFPVATPEGYKFSQTIKDGYSGYVWIQNLKLKSEASDKLIEWMRMIQRSYGKPALVYTFVSDQGGEYTSATFQKYLRTNGIRHLMGPANTPQYNAVAERANRTIGEMAECLRKSAGLPESHWGYARETAAFLRNRCPSSSNPGNQTPFYIVNGRLPDLHDLRIFGSRCMVYIPKQGRRNKLSDKAYPATFVGYSENFRSYLVIPKGSMKAVPATSVVFDEFRAAETAKENSDEFCKTMIAVISNDKEISQDENKFQILDRSGEKTEKSFEELIDGDTICLAVETIHADTNEDMHTILLEDPTSYREAMSRADSEKWEVAIREEMEALEQNQTWTDPKVLPFGERATPTKFLFVKKMNENGEVVRYKARLVYQRNNYTSKAPTEDIFSPVVSKESLRIFLHLAASKGYYLCHADIKCAFLNGPVLRNVYITLPSEIEKGRIRKLKKALYGLEEAPKRWFETFNIFMESIGWIPSEVDDCIFFGLNGMSLMIYVDDIVIAGPNKEEIDEFLNLLSDTFKTRNLGKLKYFLGMNIDYDQDNHVLVLTQKTFIQNLLGKFGGNITHGASTPMVPVERYFYAVFAAYRRAYTRVCLACRVRSLICVMLNPGNVIIIMII